MKRRPSQLLLASCLAEFIGTFALVFAGCGAVRVSGEAGFGAFEIAVVFGLVVGTMIYAVGHISGAHFNPAVTVAFAAAKHFPKTYVVPYLVAQYLAALVAVSALWLLLPDGSGFGATLPQIELWRAFGWEVILTFFLMFVIMAVATDKRAPTSLAGVAIGGTVGFCALFGGPITGASMNPARSFAPNLFEGQIQILWLYTLAPMVGAILAAQVYEFIRNDKSEAT